MNAWRCVGCHHLYTDEPLIVIEGVKSCPVCHEMVCNVTKTRIGEEFLARQSQADQNAPLVSAKKIVFMR